MQGIGSPSQHSQWMIREIHEQRDTLAATLGRYVRGNSFQEDTCASARQWLEAAKREIVIAASGSSRHAGMAAELLLEDLAGVPVDVEYASEYCYRSENGIKNASVLVISQSGETADTLAALRKAAAAGHRTLAISNVEDSTMAREATASFPTKAGRERAVPATKSFTAQLLNVYLLSLLAAEETGGLTAGALKTRLDELALLPDSIAAQLPGWESAVRSVAVRYGEAQSFLYLGRGIHYAIAREGALKLKESAYLHAEGYPSGELKHGPNALVSDGTPLVMIATFDPKSPESVQRYESVLHLMRDMRNQGAEILAIANTGDKEIAALADDILEVEPAREALMAISEVIPLQLLAYFIATNRGINVDSPRNLTKAVLTE